MCYLCQQETSTIYIKALDDNCYHIGCILSHNRYFVESPQFISSYYVVDKVDKINSPDIRAMKPPMNSKFPARLPNMTGSTSESTDWRRNIQAGHLYIDPRMLANIKTGTTLNTPNETKIGISQRRASTGGHNDKKPSNASVLLASRNTPSGGLTPEIVITDAETRVSASSTAAPSMPVLHNVKPSGPYGREHVDNWKKEAENQHGFVKVPFSVATSKEIVSLTPAQQANIKRMIGSASNSPHSSPFQHQRRLGQQSHSQQSHSHSSSKYGSQNKKK